MHRFIQKAAAFLLAFTLVFAGASAVSANSAESREPVLVPIKNTIEEAGGSVLWDKNSRCIIINLEADTYVLFVDMNLAYKNNEPVILQTGVISNKGQSFLTLDDLMALLTADTGYLSMTANTAALGAAQVMELLSVPGITIAIVDAENDFTWTQGFGIAGPGKAVDEYTLFNLASISKSFTAIAVMQLAEKGVIHLDEPIVTYLPGLKMPADYLAGTGDYRNITPRMLLSHASGIHGDVMASGVLTTGGYNPGFMDNFFEIIETLPMNAPEATVFSYANNSFTLLGILVAEMMGYDSFFEGFAEYAGENIFKPAGMELTTFVLEDKHRPYLAHPYADAATQEEFLYYNALPAGGIFSNAHDMARFMHTLLNGGTYEGKRIISENTLKQMLEIQDFEFDESPDILAPNMNPGLGFLYMTGMDGFTMTGHPGNLVHYHSMMAMDLESKLGVFVSVNSITGMAVPEILPALILQTAVMEKTGRLNMPLSDASVVPVDWTREELQEFEGFYSFIGADDLMRVRLLEDGFLYILNFPGLPGPMQLIPLSDGSFIDADSGLRLWFEEYLGELLFYLGEFKSMLLGAKIDAYDFQAPDGMEKWTGTYRAVTEGNHVSLISRAVVGVDEEGYAYIRMYALHGLTPFSLLLAIDGDSFVGGIEFKIIDGKTYLAFSGVKMVKE